MFENDLQIVNDQSRARRRRAPRAAERIALLPFVFGIAPLLTGCGADVDGPEEATLGKHALTTQKELTVNKASNEMIGLGSDAPSATGRKKLKIGEPDSPLGELEYTADLGEESRQLYRLPYKDFTDVKFSRDHLTHSDELTRLDLVGVNGGPTYQIVAAQTGVIEELVDTNTVNCPGGSCPNNYIWLSHSNGEWTKYSHIATNSAKALGLAKGQVVQIGQALGIEADVGRADGRHLHFEVAVPDDVAAPLNGGGFIIGKNRIPRFCSIHEGVGFHGEIHPALPCSTLFEGYETRTTNAGDDVEAFAFCDTDQVLTGFGGRVDGNGNFSDFSVYCRDIGSNGALSAAEQRWDQGGQGEERSLHADKDHVIVAAGGIVTNDNVHRLVARQCAWRASSRRLDLDACKFITDPPNAGSDAELLLDAHDYHDDVLDPRVVAVGLGMTASNDNLSVIKMRIGFLK